MFPRTLSTMLLTFAMTFGAQVVLPTQADARPGSILVESRESGKRTHKGRATTSKSKSSKSKSKSKSSRSRSTTSRRTATSNGSYRTGRTRPATSTRSASTRSTRTTTTRRPTRTTTTTTRPTRTTRTTRTVRSQPTRTTHTRTTRTVRSAPRGNRVRRTTYHSGHRTRHVHHTSHHSSHSHTSSHTRSSTRSGRTHGRATIDPYVTGGLGISGFAADAIVDKALPGIGYNLAVGAKGKLLGAELGLNGGGYTLDPGNASTDIGLIGLSGDLKVQPSIGIFEPFAYLGVGGYALHDGVINEASGGIGVRAGLGADFRFDKVALRAQYQFGLYGMGNESGAYGGDFGAKTETLGASLVVYF